jgi:hypothetical protein
LAQFRRPGFAVGLAIGGGKGWREGLAGREGAWTATAKMASMMARRIRLATEMVSTAQGR